MNQLPEDHLPPDHELPECPGCGALLSENAHRCPACGARVVRPGSQVSVAFCVTMVLAVAVVIAIFVFVLSST